MSGIRVELDVEGATACPMVRASTVSDGSCHLVSRSLPDDSGQVLEEFVADPGVELEGDAIEAVFTYESKHVYRARRDRGVNCPCEHFDRLGYSLVDVSAEGGTMSIISHIGDMDELRRVVDDLREYFPSVSVQRLVRLDEERSARDLVVVDMADLTDRQREVLETAHEMGYFEHPRRSNSGEVSDHLGINRSTFSQHLSSAQRKIFDSILDR